MEKTTTHSTEVRGTQGMLKYANTGDCGDADCQDYPKCIHGRKSDGQHIPSDKGENTYTVAIKVLQRLYASASYCAERLPTVRVRAPMPQQQHQ